MCRISLTRKVLEIIAQKIENDAQPNVTDTGSIALQLQLSIPETKQILKMMSEMGVVESNIDTEYSLITSEGLSKLAL